MASEDSGALEFLSTPHPRPFKNNKYNQIHKLQVSKLETTYLEKPQHPIKWVAPTLCKYKIHVTSWHPLQSMPASGGPQQRKQQVSKLKTTCCTCRNTTTSINWVVPTLCKYKTHVTSWHPLQSMPFYGVSKGLHFHFTVMSFPAQLAQTVVCLVN